MSSNKQSVNVFDIITYPFSELVEKGFPKLTVKQRNSLSPDERDLLSKLRTQVRKIQYQILKDNKKSR